MDYMSDACTHAAQREKQSGEPPQNAINLRDVSSEVSPMTSAITKTSFQRQEIDASSQGETAGRLVGGEGTFK